MCVEGGARATDGKNPSRRSGWPKLLVCSMTGNEQDERLNSKERSNGDDEERRSLLFNDPSRFFDFWGILDFYDLSVVLVPTDIQTNIHTETNSKTYLAFFIFINYSHLFMLELWNLRGKDLARVDMTSGPHYVYRSKTPFVMRKDAILTAKAF